MSTQKGEEDYDRTGGKKEQSNGVGGGRERRLKRELTTFQSRVENKTGGGGDKDQNAPIKMSDMVKKEGT